VESSIGASLVERAARLLEEQRGNRMEAVERLAFLAEAGALLSSSLDAVTTLELVARIALPRFADCCSVELLDEDGRLERIEVAHAVTEKDAVLQAGLSRRGDGHRAASGSDELFLAEVNGEPPADSARRALFLLIEPRSFLAVPLRAGGRTLGVWSFAITESSRRFNDADLTFARQLAARAALAVENTRLHAEERRTRAAAEGTADRLARLQRITSALSSASTPAEVAGVIIREAAEVLGAEAGLFAVTSADGRTLERVSCFGSAALETNPKLQRIPIETPVPIAEAARTREPILIDSPSEVRARFPLFETIVPIRAGGLAAAPLIVHERVIGAFHFCFGEGRHPRDTDRDFLLTLAPLGAQALERAQLFEVAERTRAQHAASEARFRTLAEVLPQQVWIQNGSGQVEYFNARLLEYLGMHEGSAPMDRSQFIASFVHPDDQPRVRAAWEEAKRNRSQYEVESRRRRFDGEYRWFLSRAAPLRGPDGEVTHWLGTATDIQAQKETEAELQRSEARFRRLAETAILGVGFFGVDGTVTFANEAALAITGFRREDVAAGRLSWRAITPPEYREVDDRALEEMVRNGFCAPYEKEYLRQDGTRVPVLMGAALFDRSAAEGVGFVIDLTELKRVEAAHAALVERDRVFHERLVGIVGHDLKNPLAAVLASANLLKLTSQPSDAALGWVERIERSAYRMVRMIDQLFDFARIRQGDGIPIERTRFDLAMLCREVIDELAAAHPDVSIALEAPGALVGDWDRDRLEQVVSNLVGNAIDHGRGSAVAVRALADADAVRLEVHNLGPPIPAENLPDVFDPFRRAKATSGHSSRNLGLGLYIVREIVRAHDGAIEVFSKAGDGTCFTVRLPRRAAIDRIPSSP
jgi:PAS domain S-box-containing protein